ncbi:TetR/AcrR family transcriptional regulator [Streptomyces tremellae]|uniref:TetR/AcrR family transcriptional regulator n=1 Tax=Streptomyces tremellae TaxID=1124239 RepID=A0ABP7FS55_9ACTN
MARTDPRGGPETRKRIAATASRLFAERGFDGVTVAQVGEAAGVSSVTVFKYFPKKEDLYFDRADEIRELLLAALRGCGTREEALAALGGLLLDLLDRNHPLSGTDERSTVFFATVAGSPALLARARQLAAESQHAMALSLERDGFEGDAALVAAFFTAGYSCVLTETATDLIAGSPREVLVERHRARIRRLLHALGNGVL